MKPTWYRSMVGGGLALLFPALAWDQGAPEVGVVTTIEGQATVARLARASPLPLKFRDSIFETDRINTGEKAIVRVLMGGRAIITVRELSVLTITEEVGRTVVNLESGKIAVGVARQRMKPGETLEVHTPNAVAAVRGTVFVVEVSRQGAQLGGGNLGASPSTQVTTVNGTVLLGALGNPASGAPVHAFETRGVIGNIVGQSRTVGRGEMTSLISSFTANRQISPGSHLSQTSAHEASKLVAIATTLAAAAAGDNLKGAPTGSTLNLPMIVPKTPTPTPPAPPPPDKKDIVNGGFETGSFASGWNLNGSGQVVAGFGQFAPPTDIFMGFLSSGPGSLPDPTGHFTQASTLAQPFQVTAGTLYTVKATYNFVSNEYPYWVNLYNGASPFNDAFNIAMKGPNGQSTQLTQLQVNGAFTPSQVSQQNVSVAGFTAGGDCQTCAWGYTGFKTVSFSWLAPSSGEASLIFTVGDVGDTAYASGLLLDDISALQDPPLYLLQGGSTFTSTATTPLLDFTGGSLKFDSAMVVADGSKASLAGPLLRATDANLTVPTSLLTVLPGGSFTSTTTEPLVSLKGGTHFLGTDVAMFDIAGSGTALDLATGWTLATATPLKTGGTLFEADGATVTTQQVARLDQALLEATAPLLYLKNGSQLTSGSDAITLGGRSRLTSDASALVALSASRMLVSMGSLVNVSGGSVLNLTGSLVSLSNGSSLSLLNGSLLSVSGGSYAGIGGSLVAFGGSGGNLLSVSNNLCGGSCAMIGGIPVALLNGATAANISIAGSAIQNPSLGAVKLGTPSTALVTVSGAGSKVTIGKQ